MIVTQGKEPIGFANRYAREGCPDAWYLGISVCKDRCFSRGLGTEALRLGVYYLFTNSEIHRLGLDTWSNNPRMKRAAAKAGFVHEGGERELLAWEGRRLSLAHYGILRRQWEDTGSDPQVPDQTLSASDRAIEGQRCAEQQAHAARPGESGT